MKAVYFNKPEGESALEYGELPEPTAGANQAVVRIQSAALNYLDLHMLHGRREVELPHVLGSDGAGIVESAPVGSVFSAGDEVLINPGIPCGLCSRCAAGQECERIDILGFNTQGTFAELIAVSVSQLFRKPKRWSFEQAAAAPLTFLTAWRMLVTKGKLQEGETVAIWGASGGLGSAALLLAHHLGTRTITFTGSTDKAEKLRANGADEVIDYKAEPVVERVRALTKGEGVDLVFESIGEATWQDTLEMLRFGGRIVIAGTTSGNVASQDLSDVYYRQISILGSRMGSPTDFANMMDFVEKRNIDPIIDSVYPLSNAREAINKLQGGDFVGKIVLSVP